MGNSVRRDFTSGIKSGNLNSSLSLRKTITDTSKSVRKEITAYSKRNSDICEGKIEKRSRDIIIADVCLLSKIEICFFSFVYVSGRFIIVIAVVPRQTDRPISDANSSG